jgi:hypothetical protein
MADLPARDDRVAVSGLIPGSNNEGAAYAAYLKMLSSGSVQLSAKVVHEYLNKCSLVVSSGPAGPRFRLHGDHTLLASGEGAWRAAQAATASRRAISELLHYGETAISGWEIFDSFPSHVEQNGRLITLDEWHQTVLRDLCFRELFGRWSTRAMRRVVSGAFDQLGTRRLAGLTGRRGHGTRSLNQARQPRRRTDRACCTRPGTSPPERLSQAPPPGPRS